MNTCFVIQPFDKGKFDKRYIGTFKPAIEDAGLKAYRVDKDPGVVIPIEDIHTGIEDSVLCLADITTDNPNVWYELGYAIASQKDVVLVCGKERETKFPFDVQHRTIIPYESEAASDFDDLKSKITESISARLGKAQSIKALNSIQSVSKTDGLEQYELAALVLIGQELSGKISASSLKSDMIKSGFTEIATMLAVRLLKGKGFILEIEEHDISGPFAAFEATDDGIQWLIDNKDKLVINQPKPKEEFPF